MNNKTNIEKDIKIAEQLITTKFNNDYSIDSADKQAIENILADRERLEKETENQKYIIQQKDLEMLDIKDSKCLVKRYFKLKDNNKELQSKANNYDSLVEKIKENLVKLQEEYELLLEHQNGQESNRTKYLRGKIHMCQELLDTENR